MSFRVILLIYSAYRETADADAQGNVGLLKCTGLLKAWPIMTGVHLTACGSCLFLNGSGGLRIFALVPDCWHLFMPMCHCTRGLLTQSMYHLVLQYVLGPQLAWPQSSPDSGSTRRLRRRQKPSTNRAPRVSICHHSRTKQIQPIVWLQKVHQLCHAQSKNQTAYARFCFLLQHQPCVSANGGKQLIPDRQQRDKAIIFTHCNIPFVKNARN